MEISNHGNFKILPPKLPSPIHTNKASAPLLPIETSRVPLIPVSPSKPTINSSPVPPLKTGVSLQQQLTFTSSSFCPLPPPHSPALASNASQPSIPSSAPLPNNLPPVTPPSSTPLVEKIRKLENKTLRRLAPVTLTDNGVPRVLIPDSVFEKGAEIHKNFIICYFNGRPPPINQVQSVLNHMWGKGKRVEIHPNPLTRSMLVRIPSDYLRQKNLEKSVWYVGESMFHAVQWSSSVSSTPPSLESIQIWAHLTGIPLDLRHEEGLSLVAGLVGEPKETDDFTKNMVSLTLSHVKVAVDLTKPLPKVVEFIRQSGEVVEVQVSYPWVPATCSHCKELGHVSRNCILLPPPSKSSDVPAKKNQKSAATPSNGKNKGKQATSSDHSDPKVVVTAEASSSTTAPPAPPLPPSPSLPLPDPLVPLPSPYPPEKIPPSITFLSPSLSTSNSQAIIPSPSSIPKSSPLPPFTLT